VGYPIAETSRGHAIGAGTLLDVYACQRKEVTSMQAVDDLIEIEPSVRADQFDDVLGTCSELEGMLGRLRRQHLIPDEDYALCQRRVESIHDHLAGRQESWRTRARRFRLVS
jgi:hypothetical protein